MDHTAKSKVTVKLFIGFLISSEVKMHLNDSPAWRNAKAMASAENLVEVRHQGCDYIGYYLKDAIVQLYALKKHEETAAAKLKSYCPNLPAEAYKFVIFSQLFIQ